MTPENILDRLPPWNREIAKGLKPVTPVVDALLIGMAILCILAIVYLDTEYKLLFMAYLVSP